MVNKEIKYKEVFIKGRLIEVCEKKSEENDLIRERRLSPDGVEVHRRGNSTYEMRS